MSRNKGSARRLPLTTCDHCGHTSIDETNVPHKTRVTIADMKWLVTLMERQPVWTRRDLAIEAKMTAGRADMLLGWARDWGRVEKVGRGLWRVRPRPVEAVACG